MKGLAALLGSTGVGVFEQAAIKADVPMKRAAKTRFVFMLSPEYFLIFLITAQKWH